jgi:hypothetical protein
MKRNSRKTENKRCRDRVFIDATQDLSLAGKRAGSVSFWMVEVSRLIDSPWSGSGHRCTGYQATWWPRRERHAGADAG